MAERPNPDQESFSNSLLSTDAIKMHMEKGNIVIDPFKEEQLGTVSYDVTLGKYYYREQERSSLKRFYSPWSKEDVDEVWGKHQIAKEAGTVFGEQGMSIPDGIGEDDKIILIEPGETILAHTNEFLGGRNNVTTMMKARSSLGRNFIAVCKCAGWGDVGYINRWTMEITNFSRYNTIPLVVGRRIAQIAFFQVDPITGADYTQSGKYQTDQDLDKLKEKWLPNMMLPRMYKDREVANK